MRFYYAPYVFLAFVLLFQTGCKKDTAAPNTTNNTTNNPGSPSGTLVFETAVSEVSTTTLGSGVSAVLFHGDGPSWTPDGRIVSDVWGDYTANGNEQMVVENTNGTGLVTLVDMGQRNSYVHGNPKFSRDGKYVSFNYYDGKNSLALIGLEIYDMKGTLVFTGKNLWDASWAPDGSLIASGTVYSLDAGGPVTNGAAGLFRISNNFKQVSAVGTGLSQPWCPSISPDGKKVAFAMNNHIWVMNVDGSSLTQITTGPNEETYSAWSPDGSLIAAVSNGDFSYTSFNALAIVSANPAKPTTVSQSESVWVKDKNNTYGLLNPVGGNIAWK